MNKIYNLQLWIYCTVYVLLIFVNWLKLILHKNGCFSFLRTLAVFRRNLQASVRQSPFLVASGFFRSIWCTRKRDYRFARAIFPREKSIAQARPLSHIPLSMPLSLCWFSPPPTRHASPSHPRGRVTSIYAAPTLCWLDRNEPNSISNNVSPVSEARALRGTGLPSIYGCIDCHTVSLSPSFSLSFSLVTSERYLGVVTSRGFDG